jgi:hypothetical protein
MKLMDAVQDALRVKNYAYSTKKHTCIIKRTELV